MLNEAGPCIKLPRPPPRHDHPNTNSTVLTGRVEPGTPSAAGDAASFTDAVASLLVGFPHDGVRAARRAPMAIVRAALAIAISSDALAWLRGLMPAFLATACSVLYGMLSRLAKMTLLDRA